MQTISRPEMYKLIAENSTDVIYTVGLDEKFRFVSPSVEKMFGYKPKEVLGKSVKNFLTPDSYKSQSEGMRKALMENDADVSEKMTLEVISKEGELVWVEIHAKFLVDNKNNQIGILGVARDVSDRIRMEKELKKKVVELEILNKPLG